MVAMTIPDTVLLVIYALAVARVTGLITADALTDDIRDSIVGWLDDRPKTLGRYLAILITCPWCSGMWVALVTSPLAWFFGDSPIMLVPAIALAFSQLTGMISNMGR
jgi:hypothetical protein